jgi:hypothetical protein
MELIARSAHRKTRLENKGGTNERDGDATKNKTTLTASASYKRTKSARKRTSGVESRMLEDTHTTVR